ncbi:MAG: 5-formyltetrahydrofolate cyclo-ligase [Xanthobacteraceae bacterium]|nr:5-formyltetrahydrofolate cyclo-ligase [Xanthobacteraceae bacterium]
MSPPKTSPLKTKIELRSEAIAQREALSAAQRKKAARAIAAHEWPVEVPPGVCVAGFSSIRSEIDVSPLMQALSKRGAALALPVLAGQDQPLIFRRWSESARLVRGPYGIFEPSSEADEVDPDIVLVPLAAFDRAGHRIGYGGGYYDRTLERLRKLKKITAIGIGFSVQEIAQVPSSEHDVQLDLVLTENEIIDFRSL